MNDLDLLEHGGGGFKIRLGDDLIEMPDPRQMHYQTVLVHLHARIAPAPDNVLIDDVPMWTWSTIFERWAAAWDLPDFPAARRLAYVVDHYRGALTHDLLVHAGLDLGTEWRERRWRRLLDVIDRLPGHSHYSTSLSNDEEYAEMVARAAAERGETKPGAKDDAGPSLLTWTPEVAMLATVVDAIHALRHTTVTLQVPKGKAGDPPKPERRPQTALEKAFRKAEYARRKAAHESLVARVLPHKAAVKP